MGAAKAGAGTGVGGGAGGWAGAGAGTGADIVLEVEWKQYPPAEVAKCPSQGLVIHDDGCIISSRQFVCDHHLENET